MTNTLTHLGDMPVSTFLTEYWQKKPVLIRGAFKGTESIISADELAGLSLEDDVNARLIVESPKQGTSDWQVTHGPLDESIFANLPQSHWSLLVQHVDALDPRINDFLQQFKFLPHWRLDDIMISYASDQGGVGPHFDYYDVILIQAAGSRRWRIGQKCSSASALVAGQPMKILQQFDTVEDWLVEPGDLLYIPARVAHWGEAKGESITYSVGFRAPSHADILLDYAQEQASRISEDERYQDPEATLNNPPSEINGQQIAALQRILHQYANDKHALARWLGEYSTTLKQDIAPMLEPPLEEELTEHPMQLSPYCRSTYYCEDSAEDAHAELFINGQHWECTLAFARMCCELSPFKMNQLNNTDRQVAEEIWALEWLRIA